MDLDFFFFFFYAWKPELGSVYFVNLQVVTCVRTLRRRYKSVQVCTIVRYNAMSTMGTFFFFSLCLINHSHNYIVRRSHIVLVFISRCLHHASSVTKNGSVLKKKETLNFLNFVSTKNIIHFLLGRCKLTCRKGEKKEKK